MAGRRTAVSLAVAAALATAASAGATIVPGHSVAGAKLLQTRHEIRAVLGAPNEVVHATNDFGAYTEFRYTRLRVVFQGDAGATAIGTWRFAERTAAGIGRGSTKAALRAAYANAHCRREPNGFNHCWLGRFRPGRRVTDFRIVRGRVRSVLVGFVID